MGQTGENPLCGLKGKENRKMRQVTINLRGESGVVLMYDGKSWEISATLKGGA